MSSTPSEVIVPSATIDADSSPILALNPGFITCDDAAVFLHESIKSHRGPESTGFILKNEQGRFFCAREAPDFPLVVSMNSKGEWEVPSGYTLEARVFTNARKTKGIDESAVEWGQRQRFFSVADLFEVMTWRRKLSRCYLSVSDGALISYTSTDSEFEQELSPRLGGKHDGSLQAFESLYDAGAVPSSILILLAVAAGSVTTVVTDSLWRRRGTLKASWRKDILQQNPPVELMPICGPVLNDAGEVAGYIHKKMLELAPAQQHVGIILKHKTRGFFIVTTPVPSDYATFDRQVLFPRDLHGNLRLPAEFRVHGFYHSTNPICDNPLPARQTELQKNFFSIKDMRIGLGRVNIAPHHRLFLCAPDGAVLRFAKPDSEKVVKLMAQLDPRSDDYQDIEQKILTDRMLPRAFVDLVAAAGTLSVLYPSSVWRKGRVYASTATGIVH
ncbi:hypothetical protein [Pseudomonas fluorescens]|uniref:DUF4329 domain-containing protein n=1 Tax=Pseudomonas fluorescens TaxID=294 RepID=A0A5E7H4M1_PSEFL|nr:hypothetical protein [Pseudomonas fluorescens]VVO58436.1 hypothetical protein PS880_00670 [Pseudomonas fluorescens]